MPSTQFFSASSKALNSASASARRSATNVSSSFKQFNTFLEAKYYPSRAVWTSKYKSNPEYPHQKFDCQ